MNERLQKKCMIASAGLHATLIVLLFVGPAFLPSGKQVVVQQINFTPDDVIEAMLAGGGNPQPAQAAPTPELTPAAPPAPPQRVEPTPVTPTPPRREEVAPPQRDPDGERVQKKALPKANLRPVVRKNGPSRKQPTTNTNPQRDAADQQRAALATAFQNAGSSVRSGTASSTTVNSPNGPGGGGRSYAGYDMFVQQFYQLRYDRALADAGDIGGQGNTSTEVSVTISRDGKVISSRIISPSPNSAQNRVVQRVLDAATFLRPFPEGSTDSQRTFNISFDLKPKKLTG